MKTHLRSLISVLLAIAGTTFALGANEPARVRVAWAPNVLNGPLFVGLEQDVFRRHGVLVETKRFEQANLMAQALIAGDVDAITGVSALPLLNLELQSPGRFRIILHSRMSVEAPFDAILVAANSPARSVTDLGGKRIACYPGTTAEAVLRAFFRQHKVDAATIRFMPMPPSAHANALSNGAVDAVFAYEPVATALVVERGARRLHDAVYAGLLADCPISVAVVSRATEKAHADATARFVAAMDEAIMLVRKSPAAARATLTKYTGVTAAVAERVPLVADATSSELDAPLLQKFADLMVELREVPKPVSVKTLIAAQR